MPWYVFQDQTAFDVWHEQIKGQLHYPKSDGVTTDYTTSHEVDGVVIAWVATEFADGLAETSLRPRKIPAEWSQSETAPL